MSRAVVYFRLLWIRWTRSLAGRGALATLVALPIVLTVVAAVATPRPPEVSWKAELTSARFPSFAVLMVGLAVSAFLVAAVVVSVQEERRGRRSVLLRLGGVDGVAAVGGAALFAAAAAICLSVAGMAVFAIGSFVAGGGLSPWPAMAAIVAGGMAAAGVAAVLGSLWLPRLPALAFAATSSLAAIGATNALAWSRLAGKPRPWGELGLVALLAPAVAVLVAGPLWRRFSSRYW